MAEPQNIVDTRTIRPAQRRPKLREETPAHAAWRAEDLDYRAAAVYRKLLIAYQIDPAPSKAQEEIINEKAESIAQSWDPKKFPDRIWSEEQVAQVKDAIVVNAKNYFNGFCMQNALKTNPKAEEKYAAYDKGRASSYLLNIFMNHVTNAADARLIATGMDALTAHGINRYIIRAATKIAQENGLNHDAHINPQLKERPTTPDAWDSQVRYVRHYWKNRLPELKAALEGSLTL